MKWSIRISIAVFAILAVVAIVGVLIIDGVTRSAIESNASQALDVPTTLQKASVNPVGGRLELHELDIANPEGFDETPRFLTLKHGQADLSFLDLLRQRVELEKITLEGIEVHLEHHGLSSNHGTILDNLEEFQKKGDPEPGKEFLVREVVLRDITVNVSFSPGGGKGMHTDLHIPEIVLEDVGTGDDAVSTAEIVSVVITSMLAAILHQGEDILPGEMLDELGKGLTQLDDVAQFGMTVAGDAFNEVGEVVDSVGKELEGIGDLFRKDEDDQ